MSSTITFDPKPEVNKHTRHPAAPIRVYSSSVGGAVTVAIDVTGDGMFHHGLRLDREQVAELHLALDFFLGATCEQDAR